MGVAEVVVKRGARGATGFTADGPTDRAARQVEAVDLVGAFVAGYLSGVLGETAGRNRSVKVFDEGKFRSSRRRN
ncbi:hypothetical protein [Streptomyces phaeolivaceus]|uniref:hypothetical protein n=1 Tax=Streptomyces phaeolivaceus TaxID=2653200 RepID=UPI001D03B4C8|nr:hypothetical protein [Streptomyces phaeolivaceus]